MSKNIGVVNISSQMKKFDSIFLQNLMRRVKTKLRAIVDRGVLASYKKMIFILRIETI
jgi:hypothetical protein